MLWKKYEKPFDLSKFIKQARRFDSFELRKYDDAARFLINNAVAIKTRKMGLKLIVIADTHGALARSEEQETAFGKFVDSVPEYDLCILLGDVPPSDIRKVFQRIPTDRMIGLLGNHDRADALRQFGIPDLTDGTSWWHKGISFGGIGGTFRYKPEQFPSYTQYESLILAEKMSQPVDVLLSHDKGFERATDSDAAHVGLIGNTYAVCRYGPQWHIHGHLHERFEQEYRNGTHEKCVYLWEYLEI